jgi:hypothetical protein
VKTGQRIVAKAEELMRQCAELEAPGVGPLQYGAPTELGEATQEPGSYKHDAPNGAAVVALWW